MMLPARVSLVTYPRRVREIAGTCPSGASSYATLVAGFFANCPSRASGVMLFYGLCWKVDEFSVMCFVWREILLKVFTL